MTDKVIIISTKRAVPTLHVGEHTIKRKGNEDFLVDAHGGWVKVSELTMAEVSYKCEV